MFSAFRTLCRASAAAALLTAASCTAGEPPAEAEIACGPSTLGVERSLTLTQDSPALYDLLERGEVVLTFDDGPDAKRTKPVLDALSAQCTRATFFLLGKNAKANPKGVRQIIEAGHTIGSHSLDHANLAYLPLDEGVQNALDGMQIFGGYSCTAEYEIGRLLLEAKSLEFGEGTSELHTKIIAETMLGVRKA